MSNDNQNRRDDERLAETENRWRENEGSALSAEDHALSQLGTDGCPNMGDY